MSPAESSSPAAPILIRVVSPLAGSKHPLDTTLEAVSAIVSACEGRFGLSQVAPSALRAPLRRAALAHGVRCDGVALGVRLALAGLDALGLGSPPPSGRVAVRVCAAHCVVDSIAATAGCSLGSHTLLVDDAGELAADFLDRTTGRSVRVTTRTGFGTARADCGGGLFTADRRSLDAAYQTAPADALFVVSDLGRFPSSLVGRS